MRSLAFATTAALTFVLAMATAAAGDCTHIDDPFQVLDLYLEMDQGDWNAVVNDTTFSDERPAMFRCDNDPPILVSVRRKPTSKAGTDKVSLKIDINEFVPDQEWGAPPNSNDGHRKVSLENGAGGVILREGFAWLLMARAGMIVGNVSWVRVHVNGEEKGIYTRVEQVDKAYLRRHLEEDDYFLYKESERRTREAETDPFLAALCYEPFDNVCPLPPGGYNTLHEDLDIPQLFTMGAVNAFIVNADALLPKTNNHWWYNSPLPRRYFPWDLDQLIVRRNQVDDDPHTYGSGNSTFQVLFGDPNLLTFFDTILVRLVQDPFHPDVLDRLLDDLTPVLRPAIQADPNMDIGHDGFDGEVAFVRQWLRDRVAYLESVLPPMEPFPIVINEVMASNNSTLVDEAGESDDWVELYNRGTSTVSLEGLYLSDKVAFPRRFAFPPGTVMPPGSHLIVWCDNDTFQGPLHAGFKLNADGETIGLYATDAELNRVLDFVWFGPQTQDVSIGRMPDASPGQQTLSSPSPGGPNEGGLAPGVVGPTLHVARGTGSSLILDWQPSCSPDADDYAIYEGQIGNWYNHTLVDCFDDLGDLTEEITPQQGDRYYLVVPKSGTSEGSYGSSSGGLFRPRGISTCEPQQSLTTTTCGIGACQVTVDTCSCTPGTPTAEICNNIDDDCDGVVDDGLGQTACGAGACYVVVPNCIAGVPQTCTPGTPTAETCNNIDDDCNLLVDDGLGQTTCGVGACEVTIEDCIFGVPQTCIPGTPSPEICDNLDNDCDGIIDGLTASCPGTVPPTVTVEHGTGSSIVLSWDPTCSAAAQDYAIYEGEIGNYYSHTEFDCSDDLGDLSEEIIPSSGNRYYFIVPRGIDYEGSYGKGSTNVERPQGISTCAPMQVLGECSP